MKNLFKAFGLVASLGLGTVLVSGCNPDEPAKTSTPAPAPSVSKPAPKADGKDAPKAAPAPTKEAEKKG